MPNDKPIILKNSKKGYQLRQGDVDLQGSVRNPLETIEVAKRTALEKLREATGLDLRLSELHPTVWGIAYLQSSTKRVGVQFEAHKPVKEGTWYLELNLDHPDLPPSDFGKKKHRRPVQGPDRPHVGYEARLTAKGGAVLKNIKAHVFVEDLAASRADVSKPENKITKPR